QNADALGERAALRLFQRIEDSSIARESIVLPTELVERATSGRQRGSERLPVIPGIIRDPGYVEGN
ncbi:MAG: hypothetical protein WCL39_08650, partial [Armatimonadota bacterium]